MNKENKEFLNDLIEVGDKMKTVDIIITTYNSEKYISDLLNSIKEQNYTKFICYVIDDASTDKTCKIVKGFKWVTLIKNEMNKGPAKNRNAVAAISKGEYIIFLDADTYLEKDWISQAVKRLSKSFYCVQLASQIVSGFDKNILLDCGIMFNGIFPEARFYKKDKELLNKAHLMEQRVMGACTAGTIVKRWAFEEVGGFDEKYFYLCEDLDLSLKFNLAGYEVIYYPNIITIHYEGQSMNQKWNLKNYLINRNLMFVLFDNYPIKYLIRNMPKLIINYIKVIGKSFILKEPKRNKLLIIKSILSILVYLPNIVKKRNGFFTKINRKELINLNNSLNCKINISTIIFQLTNKCNANCSFCFLYNTMNKQTKLLKKEELFKVFSSVQGLKEIILTGGEPILRTDLSEICNFLIYSFPKLGITIPTNGYFNKRIYDLSREMLSNGCKKLKISLSLDGNERFHDKNRQVDKLFIKVKESYDGLEKLKMIYGNRLEIQINTAVCKENINQLNFLKGYIKKEMPLATWTVEPIRGDFNSENVDGLNIKEWKIVAKRVKDLNLERLYSKVIETINKRKRNWDCTGGSGMISIDYFGNVAPCEILKPIINVKDLNYNLNKLNYNKEWTNRMCSIKNKECYCTHFCWLSNSLIKRNKLLGVIK